ncbi:MAG: outer membrane lipoprotein-sorting protein [Deltaproteobacteria bacterium]|nr:outer membrane lipoprotein-sorting protein [Deltaproteobacteria bacterium]
MNLTKTQLGIKTLLTALAFLGLQCCSPLTVKPPAPALDEESVASIVSAFAGQEKATRTLFFTGTLTLNNRGSENSAQILMIADRTSRAGTGAHSYGRMKIEITHAWGKSLLHLFLEGQRLEILDFNEKRFYRGTLRSRYLSARIPIPLNGAILWSLARAFPAVLKHHKAASFAGDQITLMDAEDVKVQVFDLYSSEPLPHRVSFLKENAEMIFSDFEDEDGILYARRVSFHSPGHEISLTIRIDQMKFNTLIPEAVFEMVPPRDFKTVNLREDHLER